MNNKATCPNCGAEGTAGRFCEYCGTKIPMPQPKRRKSKLSKDLTTKVVKFKIGRDEAIKVFLNKLSETENLPKDIFEKMVIDEVVSYFVPTFYYHCNFDAPWSCTKLVYEKYKIGNETKTRIKRYPMNGVARGGFDYVLPSCCKDDIPSELYNFLNDEKSNIAYYDKSEDTELVENDSSIWLKPCGDNERAVLHKNDVDSIVDLRVSLAVRKQMPVDREDMSYTYSYSNSIGKDLILPFWLIRYTYDNKKYYFIIDGIAEISKLKCPIDDRRKMEVQKLKNKADNKELKGFFTSLLWFASFLASIPITVAIYLRIFNEIAKEEVQNMLVWCSAIYMCLIIFYRKMHKASKEGQDAQNGVQLTQYSAWLQRKRSLLMALGGKDFKLSSEMIKELIRETENRIKENVPNIEKADEERLSRKPTILIEIIGWISLLCYCIKFLVQ